METCPICGKELDSGIRADGKLYHYECFFKRERTAKVEEKHKPKVAFEDILYFEKLPSFKAVESFLMEYARPERYTEFLGLIDRYAIHQFWNQEYIMCLADEIKKRVGGELVLEVAAGDGMLSYWLRQYGVNAKATDSGAWYDRIKKRAPVEIIDAVSAIKKYKPKMVIASWLPVSEPLDIQIFNTCAEERIPYIILIGETDGACGSLTFWQDKYWEKVGYELDYLYDCDKYNFCRTDWFSPDSGWFLHSSTLIFTLKPSKT